MICKIQDKDSEISTYKAQERLEEKLRRKQELEIKSLKVELQKVCLTNFEFEKDLSELGKENHILKGQLQKIPWGWSKFKRTYGGQYLFSEQTGRRIQENRRYNKTTLRKYRKLSKTRIEDPLSEGRSGQNNYSVKDKFEDWEEHWRK